MDDIYSLLITIDFPDAITGGLRRTTDAARGILEKTRGDLTIAVGQAQLERTMRALKQDLQKM
jgi:translin